MRITRISWQIFSVCLGITFLSVVSIAIYASHTYRKLYLRNFVADSVVKSTLIRQQLESYLITAQSMNTVDSLCKTIGRSIKTRITVIEPSGLVLGDSKTDPGRMESHAYRPEIMAALKGETGVQQRFSPTLELSMLYVAVPVMHNGKIRAVLRLSEPLQHIRKHVNQFYMNVGLASVTTLLLIALASMSIARTLSKPVMEMKNGAERIAAGDLDFRLRIPEVEEIRGLAEVLNNMAESLGERIRTITSQKKKLDAILSGMSEGVLATDVNERIIIINPAAAELLAISADDAKGMWIYEIVRNSALHGFVQDILKNDSMLETSFTLPGRTGERYIDAKGKILGISGSSPDGVLMVLHEVTSVKRLEEVRREFVANVSHELRTPLTSIKGFVETIINEEYCLPPDVQKYLEIISRKTDRLCSIVDDLLTLAAIEREYEQQEIQLEPANIKAVLEGAVRTCYAKAELKKISFDINCEDDIEVVTNADFLEQAVSNLVDNAVKYSPEGKMVSVKGEKSGEELIISVTDEGIGIPQEHHQRIFERFYRVDKARSRRIGGTGLGLSIVKNICLSLGGKVTVESEVGKGSTFRIILGRKEPKSGSSVLI